MQKENDAKAILFLQEIKCRFPPNLFDKKNAVATLAGYRVGVIPLCSFLHHATHAAHTWGTHRHFGLVLFLLNNNTLSSEEHSCY